MADYTVKRNDTAKTMPATLKDVDDVVVNLTDATIVWSMRGKSDRVLKVDQKSASIVNSPGTDGKVEYTWAAADVDLSGEFEGEWQVTFSGGKIQTYPNDRHAQVRVVDDIA